MNFLLKKYRYVATIFEKKGKKREKDATICMFAFRTSLFFLICRKYSSNKGAYSSYFYV